LIKDTLLVVQGQVSVDEFTGGFKMGAEALYSIDQARNTYAKRLEIKLNAEQMANGFMKDLKSVLRPSEEGACPIVVYYQGAEAEAIVKLGREWRVHLSNDVLDSLRGLAGPESVRVCYG